MLEAGASAKRSAERLETLKQYLQKHAPFLGGAAQGGSTGFSALDELLKGGYPKGAITALVGEPGVGCLTLASRAAAQRTGPVAWVDAKGTLYPPALLASGVRLERLLMVRGGGEKALSAAEQVIETGAFELVVICGAARALCAPTLRRVQTATEGAQSSTLLLLPPEAAQRLTGVALHLQLRRRAGAIQVEVKKDRSGAANGRRVLLTEG